MSLKKKNKSKSYPSINDISFPRRRKRGYKSLITNTITQRKTKNKRGYNRNKTVHGIYHYNHRKPPKPPHVLSLEREPTPTEEIEECNATQMLKEMDSLKITRKKK
eukprot:149157_1